MFQFIFIALQYYRKILVKDKLKLQGGFKFSVFLWHFFVFNFIMILFYYIYQMYSINLIERNEITTC